MIQCNDAPESVCKLKAILFIIATSFFHILADTGGKGASFSRVAKTSLATGHFFLQTYLINLNN